MAHREMLAHSIDAIHESNASVKFVAGLGILVRMNAPARALAGKP